METTWSREDFGPYSWWRIVLPDLIVSLIGLGTIPAILVVVLIADLNDGVANPNTVRIGVPLVTAGVLAVGLFIYRVVLMPCRLRLDSKGVSVLGPLGWRSRLWSSFRRAKLTSVKGRSFTVVLRDGGPWAVRVCLSDYRKCRSLLEAIRSRLSVPVQGHPVLFDLVRDRE